ncbi:lysozyme family protein [Neisseria perflava]|nr:lysozyme family protein [Neisseria perflava]
MNHGVKRAVILLQRAAGADDDGKFGKDTLAAVKCASPNRLVARFNGYRLQFYTQIKTFPTFGKGWSRRVAGNLRHAVNDGCSAELRTIARGIEAYFDAHSAKAAGAKANMAAFAQKLKETA